MYHSKDDGQKINTGHSKVRGKLRKIGPICTVLGICCFGAAVVGIFSGNMSMGILGFLGIPLMFVGGVTSMFGFGGAVARYQMGEMAPVAKDTINYMADGTKGSVKTMAKAMGEGLSEGFSEGGTNTIAGQIPCPSCEHNNDHDAKFCDNCGATLQQTCSQCEHTNDHDAKFCDNCGTRFV